MKKTPPPSGPHQNTKAPQESVFDEFLNDIENDMRLEKYQKLWATYGKGLTAALTILLTAAVVFGLWNRYENGKREEIASHFLQAQGLMLEGRAQEALSHMKVLSEAGSKNYQILAQLSKAALLEKTDFENSVSEIQTLYKGIFERSAPAYFKELAAFLYANSVLRQFRLKEMDQKTADDLFALLEKYRGKNEEGIALLMTELKGLLWFKVGNNTKARGEFDKICKNAKTPPSMYVRASITIQAIQDRG